MIKSALKRTLFHVSSVFGEHSLPALQPKLWVFMYHRVLPKSDDRFALEEPGMVVTPETLQMHIKEAQRHFTVVSLNDWVQDYLSGQQLPNKACAFTFDDGWADNLEYAWPILKNSKIPATVFAVTAKMGTDFRFWPNIIAHLVAVNSDTLRQHGLFKEVATLLDRPFDREELATCINHLKTNSEHSIFTALETIKWQETLRNSKPELLSWEELKETDFEVGSHTRTHQRLHLGLDFTTLKNEITASRRELFDKEVNAVPLFCYPNGNYNAEALSLVQDHYCAAVTTRKGINRVKNLNLHELRRIPIHNDRTDSIVKFRSLLSGWI